MTQIANPPIPPIVSEPDPMGVSGTPTAAPPVAAPAGSTTAAGKTRKKREVDTEAPKRKQYVADVFKQFRAGIPLPAALPATGATDAQKAAFEAACVPLREADEKAIGKLLMQEDVKLKGIDFKQDGVGVKMFFKFKRIYHEQKAAEWRALEEGKKTLDPKKAQAKIEKIGKDLAAIAEALGAQGVDMSALGFDQDLGALFAKLTATKKAVAAQ